MPGSLSDSDVRGSNRSDTTLALRRKLGFHDELLWKRFCVRRLSIIHALNLNTRKASEQEEQVQAVAKRLCTEYGYPESATGDFEKLIRAGIQSVRRNQKRSPRNQATSSSLNSLNVNFPCGSAIAQGCYVDPGAAATENSRIAAIDSERTAPGHVHAMYPHGTLNSSLLSLRAWLRMTPPHFLTDAAQCAGDGVLQLAVASAAAHSHCPSHASLLYQAVRPGQPLHSALMQQLEVGNLLESVGSAALHNSTAILACLVSVFEDLIARTGPNPLEMVHFLAPQATTPPYTQDFSSNCEQKSAPTDSKQGATPGFVPSGVPAPQHNYQQQLVKFELSPERCGESSLQQQPLVASHMHPQPQPSSQTQLQGQVQNSQAPPAPPPQRPQSMHQPQRTPPPTEESDPPPTHARDGAEDVPAEVHASILASLHSAAPSAASAAAHDTGTSCRSSEPLVQLPPLNVPSSATAERNVTLRYADRQLHLTFSPAKNTPPTVTEILDHARHTFEIPAETVIRLRDLHRKVILDSDCELADTFCYAHIDIEVVTPPPMLPQISSTSTGFSMVAPVTIPATRPSIGLLPLMNLAPNFRTAPSKFEN